MRVIAGSARRLLLSAPKGDNTRPTSDKIKETLFNIIAPMLYGVDFLDLFAGTGGIGIEALSRGAGSCTFMEKDKEALSCIRKNLEKTHLADKATVYSTDVLTGIHMLHPSKPYGIVFMDPPYGRGLVRPVLTALKTGGLTDEDTLIIAEEAISADMSYADDLGYEITRIKEYKNNKHVFMRLSS
ncbi:MAG: 16S rRNA (guanine(966)-N(2))-methyltransferase RsmD [Lachnospiraceae bacterium]|nr:16S rRNA (guanine(966)-N(2))-methyltransferase RsmD [Lachnospiraceae bacterium]